MSESLLTLKTFPVVRFFGFTNNQVADANLIKTFVRVAFVKVDKIRVLVVFILAYLGCTTTRVYAGWFGPGNYQECVLDEMKGQNAFMLPLVAKQCTVQFACNAEARRSFEKCIDNLGGPDIYSVPTCQEDVRRLCNSSPPPPPVPQAQREILLDNNGTSIEYNLCSPNAGPLVSICLIKNKSGSTITKVVGHFAYKSPCTKEEPFTAVVGEKAWFRDRYDFRIDGEFNCWYVEFFGTHR